MWAACFSDAQCRRFQGFRGPDPAHLGDSSAGLGPWNPEKQLRKFPCFLRHNSGCASANGKHGFPCNKKALEFLHATLLDKINTQAQNAHFINKLY